MTDYNQDYDNSQASQPNASLAAENASFAQANDARMRELNAQAPTSDDWNNPDQTDVNRENSLNDRNLQNDPDTAKRKLVANANDQYANANREFDDAKKQVATADQNYTDALNDTRPVTPAETETTKPKAKRRRKKRKTKNRQKPVEPTKTTEQAAAKAETKAAVDDKKGPDQMSETKDTTTKQDPQLQLKQLDDKVEASLDRITSVSNLRDAFTEAPEDPKILKQVQDAYNKQFDTHEEVGTKNAPELLEKLRQTAVDDAQESVKTKAEFIDQHATQLGQTETETQTPSSASAEVGNNHSSKPAEAASTTPSDSASQAASAVSQNSAAQADNLAPTGAASAATPHVTQPVNKSEAGIATPKMETGTVEGTTPANAQVEKEAAADKTTVLDDDTSDHTAKTAEDVDAKLNRLESENKKLRENFKKQERIKKLEMENAQMQGGVSPDQIDKQQAQKDQKKESYASKFKQANEEMRGVSNGKLAVVAATRFGKGALAVSGKVASMAWTGLKATGRFLSRQIDKMSGKMKTSLESSLPDSTVKQAHENDKRNQGVGR